MSEKCCCNKEEKEFCIVYTTEGEERHVVLTAKDEIDAIKKFYNTVKVITSIFGSDFMLVVNRVYQEC